MSISTRPPQFDLVVFRRLDRFSREGALATLRYLKGLKDHGVNYKSFTEPYLDSLGLFGDVIVSMLATIAAQDLIEISENTKAALAKKKAEGLETYISEGAHRYFLIAFRVQRAAVRLSRKRA